MTTKLSEEDQKRLSEWVQPTLRDRFAMAALTGILSANPKSLTDATWKEETKRLANGAYNISDAMIEARKCE